ncbi:unnamed protein product [Clonostachys chloroleuca]|uniref:Uncharacterized protein n=1 Tax=Clonostachys chloroleuca TaxID=1926264 RepID=A0AA35QEL0_9HYPO|nr:unnamed protein product [Clonostachys chloroleuca]
MTLLSNVSPPLIQEALSQPMSIVDLFIPGFSNITTVASQVLNGNMTIYTQLMCLFGLATLLKPYLSQLRDWLIEDFKQIYEGTSLPLEASTVHIKQSDETYDMIQAWVSSHKLDASRSILAKVMMKRKTQDDYDAHTKKSLRYAPWEGAFYFWYRLNLFLYKATRVQVGFYPQEQISITCVGRSTSILKVFMEDCRREYLDTLKNKTIIYGHRGNCWVKEREVITRPLSTVILDEQQKMPLINDIQKFLDPKTKSRYSACSVPYRRGYLLFGPPGTGKTSFSLSIAGALDMDIYVLSIPSMKDDLLKDLFVDLPRRCVVLLEDIDAANATRSRDSSEEDSDSDGDARSQKAGLTLSGLLNVLDGVASQDDRVLIMTTNHPRKLDAALTRPGRVDKKISFQLASRTVAKEIYCFMFGQAGDVDTQPGPNEKIRNQGEEFAAKIPELKFSPAEVMAYLQQYWDSPASAIEHCREWVDDLIQEKEINAASLENDEPELA